ncbi:MAG TPA: UDP-N-acetylglucosamine 1-carboxyvinyltransferase [Acidimicrobiia bacterium]|nr:UDP-N-acetylglucosamine 1-carboxyvinyltransferase [Acidimicrobiia bacterium]
MDQIVVTGGTRLEGSVPVLGAKNAVLKQMVAMLLAPGSHRLTNVPGILDVELMGRVLDHIGAECKPDGHDLVVEIPDDLRPEAPLELVRQMRASIIVLGPLLARNGTASVAFPGGDDLGARPIDMHLAGLRALGAEFELEHGTVVGRAPNGLTGAEIDLEFPSVGATENILLAAVLARGETVLGNPAREPEVQDLVAQLSAMGAEISGAGTSRMVIRGVGELHPVDHPVVPDRLEAGTYAIAGAISRGRVRVEHCLPDHLRMELKKLAEAGCAVKRGDDWFEVEGPDRPRPIDFATLPFPGFATDMQPQMVALLAFGDGTSVVTENLYDARFRYLGELMRMGADVTTEWQHAVIRGSERLSGCPVLAPDIRAGAALVLAGLRADGDTIVSDIQHIDRGYEGFVDRLASLGAVIERRSA